MLIARLLNNHELLIKGSLTNNIPAVDFTENIDLDRGVDVSEKMNALTDLFFILFGVSSTDKQVDNVSFDLEGNLYAKEIIKAISALDTAENVDENRLVDGSINSDDDISDFFQLLFGLEINSKQPDKFSVLKDGSILINELTENQNL